MKYRVINKFDRRSLYEGRTYGLGFAFVKQLDDTTFETVHSPSTCKDYLNDVVCAERFGVDIDVFGAKVKPIGLFKDNNPLLLVKALSDSDGYNDNDRLLLIEETKKTLEAKIDYIVSIMQFVDSLFKLEQKTSCIRIRKGTYILILPKFYVKYSYLISLYSLIFRALVYTINSKKDYEPVDSLPKFLQILDSHIGLDVSLWRQAKPAFLALIEKKNLPKDSLNKNSFGYDFHNNGILSLENPKTGNTYYSDYLDPFNKA